MKPTDLLSLPNRIMKVKANALLPHPYAQRAIVSHHLKDMTKNLELDALATFAVVEYEINGKIALWIVDGQHRWQALLNRDFGDWEVTVVFYYTVKDHKTSCRLFKTLNDTAHVAPYYKFNASFGAGEAAAVGVVKILRNRDLDYSNYHADSKVCCVNTLVNVYKEDDGETLATVLDTVIATWGRAKAALEGRLLQGLAYVIADHGGEIDYKALTKKLQKYPAGAAGILGDAAGTFRRRKITLPRAVAELIIEHYNSGRSKGRLTPGGAIRKPVKTAGRAGA